MKYLALFLCFISFTSIAQINKKDAQGRKQGVWKKPYKSSSAFEYIGQFKDDKPVGKFVYFYQSGKTKAKMNFGENGVTTALMYHESGYLMAKGKYIDQKKDSTWVQYDDRGVISYQEDYKNGELHGQRVIFYEPIAGQYKVMEYSYWKNGVQHGEFKKFHPNTKVAQEGKYVDGNKDGEIKHYHPNGKVALVERYKFAVKHGYQIVFDETGKQIGFKLYWEGRELKGPEREAKIAELKQKKSN